MAFNAELNIQGKYVYGYNWKLKTFDTGGVNKAGWWRLTFYAPDVLFTPTTVVGIPTLAAATPDPLFPIIAAAAIEAEEETEGRLYVPIVRSGDNLTFIDICISAKKGGGGSSRKPPNPGE
jgi:hypothetical protein